MTASDSYKQLEPKMDFFTVLNANNYQVYNREIAKKIGINSTIILTELIDKFCYFEKSGLLTDGEWFYLTIDDVYDRTALSRDAQDGALKKLKDLGFFETRQMGLPAKRHFKLRKDKIAEWLLHSTEDRKGSHSSLRNFLKLDEGISTNSNEEFPQPAPIYKILDEDPKEEPNSCPRSEADSGMTKVPTCKKSFEKTKAKQIAMKLLSKVLEIHPKFKLPKLETWAKDIDLAFRRDNRSYEELEAAIDFAFEDSFWSHILQSADGLRRNFDKIAMKMNKGQSPVSKNRLFALEAQSQLKSKGSPTGKEIYITDSEVVKLDNGKRISLLLHPEDFEKQFLQVFELHLDR